MGEVVTSESIGRFDNWDAFTITFDLDQPVSLEGDVAYWFGLENTGGALPTARSWGAAAMSGGNTYYESTVAGSWVSVPVEMSFQLLPEPSEAHLGFAALLSLAALAVQRQRRAS